MLTSRTLIFRTPSFNEEAILSGLGHQTTLRILAILPHGIRNGIVSNVYLNRLKKIVLGLMECLLRARERFLDGEGVTHKILQIKRFAGFFSYYKLLKNPSNC